MLDSATKARIDDCRDILVGKLPDPKSQIEQITIALIYKFMYDMDKEAVELGGKPKFFSGEFKKFSWDAILDTKVSSVELVKLYDEGLTSMERNTNIPELFQNIFKNAYLPYRDPETLRLFLKSIAEFEYSHSEKLGDAFEYLLSVMGSQGDAGQFRTPRHIIDFLVEVVNPGKADKVLDPACGTAGFLISAFKYIRSENKKPLTPAEQKKLIENFVGYDISPDMVRLSLVNLYLHGFTDPHIYEYDSLSREERWNETFDVILANPPFMSPKGGIRPHKKFSVSSNRSEVLFVDYIAEHLNPKGRAGIIVPEGVIFKNDKAYKELRKMLVEECLWAVVSLPAGVFNPYSGVKTSILLLDKELAKKSDKILFVKIENDGYGLGSQRREEKGSQLPEAKLVLAKYRDLLSKGKEFKDSGIATAVLKSEISEAGKYNLSGDQYKTMEHRPSSWPIKSIGEIAVVNPRKSEIKHLDEETKVSFVPMAHLNENQIDFELIDEKRLADVYSGYTYFRENDVLLAKVTPCFENGKAGIAKDLKNGLGFGSSEYYVLRNGEETLPEWLYYFTTSVHFRKEGKARMTGTGGLKRVPKSFVESYQIPVPPIEVQKEIMAELACLHKIIDGARMVLENYQPQITIDPEWKLVELEKLCDSISDGDHQAPPKSEEGVPFITISNIKEGVIDFSKTYFVPLSYYDLIHAKRRAKPGDILYTVTGSFGVPVLIDFDKKFCFQRHIAILRPKADANGAYLYCYLKTKHAFSQAEKAATGAAQKTVALRSLRSFNIPMPATAIQDEIVEKIQLEEDIVNSNKQLIQIFEQKIKDRIAEVWGN